MLNTENKTSSTSNEKINSSNNSNNNNNNNNMSSSSNIPPTNEFWIKKITFYFSEILDINNDGKVNSSDIDMFRELYRQLKGLDHDSPKLHSFSEFLEKWLTAIMLADQKFGNNDGSITIEEFFKYCEQLRIELYGRKTWPSSLSYMSEYIEALFSVLDSDNDGYICKNNFLNTNSSYEDVNSRMASWNLISEQNDSFKIDKNLFNELSIEFLVSTSPNDRGNWIFGLFNYK